MKDKIELKKEASLIMNDLLMCKNDLENQLEEMKKYLDRINNSISKILKNIKVDLDGYEVN